MPEAFQLRAFALVLKAAAAVAVIVSGANADCLRLFPKLKVLRSVVIALSVDVMNVFVPLQRSAKLLLHDVPVRPHPMR